MCSCVDQGALASLVAQVVTTPLDVARTRMMINDKETGKESTAMMSKGIFEYAAYIGETEGVLALFAGLEPRVVRALVSGGIQFFTYEITQNALR